MTPRRLTLLAAVALLATAAPVHLAFRDGAVVLRPAEALAAETGGHTGGAGGRGGGHAGSGRHGGGSEGHGGCGDSGGGCGGGAHPGGGHVPGDVTSEVPTGEEHDAEAHAGHAGGRGGPGAGGHGGAGAAAGHGGRDAAATQMPTHEGRGAGRHDAGVPEPGGSRGWPGGGMTSGIELGRLNVARVPSRVLDRALAEAEAGLGPEAAAWYALPLDEALARLPELGHGALLEGPLANLSLYRAVMAGDDLPVTPANRLDLAALLLGSAAGRHAPVEPETVMAVSTLLGVGDRLDPASLARLTAGAERVRQAILASHGDEHGEESGGH